MIFASQNFHSKEIDETPLEFLLTLFQIVNAFKESVMIKPAEASIKQCWKEALRGEVSPISELWDGIDEDVAHSKKAGHYFSLP